MNAEDEATLIAETDSAATFCRAPSCRCSFRAMRLMFSDTAVCSRLRRTQRLPQHDSRVIAASRFEVSAPYGADGRTDTQPRWYAFMRQKMPAADIRGQRATSLQVIAATHAFFL